MNKDVLYIDVDDDITAIIGKVKASKEKVVALVPPKRVGVLQSAVNLRLLQRAASNDHKHLVLITNNQALMALAASAKLPVAKNAQSKPEIPEAAALDVDDGEDIIDGSELPVGDHARMAGDSGGDELDAAASTIIDGESVSESSAPASSKTLKTKKGPKVPDFSMFRKKVVLIGAGVVGLIVFLVWALIFAPHATVVITARTSDVNVSKTIAVSTTNATDFSSGTIKAISQQKKKPTSVDFDATGQENKGNKATGTVEFSTNNISNLGTTIPAGTELTSSGGKVYLTNQSVTITIDNYTGATTAVTAAGPGASYNGATGSVSGAPSGISAAFTDATANGTDRNVKVVTAADVQKAAQQLATQEDQTIKSQLKAAFGDNVTIIESSYKVDKSTPVSTPAVGQEAGGKVKLTTEITYSILGVSETQLNKYLDAAVKDKIADQPDQQMYDNGAKKASFSDFQTEGDTSRVRIAANGKVGPDIDKEKIKEQVKGKRFGDIQADLESIQGVDDIDVKFFPFWVRTVPGDVKKITIEFRVND